MCNNRNGNEHEKGGCAKCTCPPERLLSFKVLSTGRPDEEGLVFAIGALVKDFNKNTTDRFVGSCSRKDAELVENVQQQKHPGLKKHPETHRDFYHLIQCFSVFCEKYSESPVILWGAKSAEVIFIRHLMTYGLMREDLPVIASPFVPNDPLMFAVRNGIRGTENPSSILFVPEVTISHFLNIYTLAKGEENHTVKPDYSSIPLITHPLHTTRQ